MNNADDILQMAKTLQITPKEVRYLMKEFKMPLDPDEWGKWAESHMEIIIRAKSGFYKELSNNLL